MITVVIFLHCWIILFISFFWVLYIWFVFTNACICRIFQQIKSCTHGPHSVQCLRMPRSARNRIGSDHEERTRWRKRRGEKDSLRKGEATCNPVALGLALCGCSLQALMTNALNMISTFPPTSDRHLRRGSARACCSPSSYVRVLFWVRGDFW